MEETKIALIYATGSDIGKVRKQNEDSVFCCDFNQSEITLLIVADGVGGYAGGEVASKLAVNNIHDEIEKSILQTQSGGGFSDQWLQTTLQQAVLKANSQIRQKQQNELSEMASTVVTMLIHDNKIALSYLGDSRCYRYQSGQFEQITEDHSMLQKMLNEGEITQQQFETMPLHHMITQALGLIDKPDVIVNEFLFEPASLYLLCSDGLTDCVSDAQIQHILSVNVELDKCVDELITAANDNGGVDNITVALIKRLS